MSDKKKRSVVKTRTVTKKDGTKIVSKSKTVINKKGNTITRSKVKTRTKGGGGSTVKSSSADLKNPRRNQKRSKDRVLGWESTSTKFKGEGPVKKTWSGSNRQASGKGVHQTGVKKRKVKAKGGGWTFTDTKIPKK